MTCEDVEEDEVTARPVTSIHQIEVTTRCNLRCVYCPSPNLPRAKVDMTLTTFERALAWAKHYETKGTQGELSLTGIGEGLLHPEFVTMVRLAREALPRNLLVITTNGLLVTEEFCAAVAPYRPRMYISLHRPEKARMAIHWAERYGLLQGTNQAAVLSSFNWAGSLKWPVSAPKIVCEYLRTGWSVVLVDGRIATCCLDASGASMVGHIDDPVGQAYVRPWEGPNNTGCASCHMVLPKEVA